MLSGNNADSGSKFSSMKRRRAAQHSTAATHRVIEDCAHREYFAKKTRFLEPYAIGARANRHIEMSRLP